MLNKPKIHGVLPVLQMPYKEDESIDYDVLEKETEHVFKYGADGVVLALASELLRLNYCERLELTSKIPQIVNKRGTVTISVGAETSRDAANYAVNAEKAGADAVMAIPPVATPISAGKKLDYYRTIYNSISIPLIIQDASGYLGGEKMSVEIMARLRNELGDRVYYKPEGNPVGPTISGLQTALKNTAVVLEGSGGYLLIDSYHRGVSGTMPGSDLIRGIVEIWRNLEKGDEDRAYEVYCRMVPIVLLETPSLDAFLSIEKHLLVKQGIFKNTKVRQPSAYDLDKDTAKEVDRLYERFVEFLDS